MVSFSVRFNNKLIWPEEGLGYNKKLLVPISSRMLTLLPVSIPTRIKLFLVMLSEQPNALVTTSVTE